jgi:diguanylate cyclase (GGDEF)-like protein
VKIQTKIFLLLCAMVSAFLMGVTFLWDSALDRADILFRDTQHERSALFNNLVELEGAPLEAFVDQTSSWNELVTFAEGRDESWAKINLDDAALATHGADALWVYGPDLRLLYAHNRLSPVALRKAPIPASAIKALFADHRKAHFFAQTSLGLFEVRGATLHPSSDRYRSGPVRGYFFAARRWSHEHLEALSRMTDSDVQIVRAGVAAPLLDPDSEEGVIRFARVLYGWNGSPVVRVEVRAESEIIRVLKHSNHEFLLLLALATALFVLLFVILMRWVRTPLVLLSRALTYEDAGPIRSLLGEHTEFGQLSVLIHRFFRQRAELVREVADRQRAEEQLVHDALHDSLTGLPNRTLFTDRLEGAIARARRRPNGLFAVLFLDVDRFKVVNDSLGHMVGDRLLRAIARRIPACLRDTDTFARLGGDEFAVLLEELRDPAEALRMADRIQRELALPFDLEGQEVFTTASIGIALSSIGYSRAEELLRDSDTAMYRAKALGKARYEVFDEAMRARAVALLNLETDLRRALERGELRLFYQPIVSLESGRIVGLEALLRWQHPELGLLAPDEFVPLAEETGLITFLDRWLLRQACLQLGAWHARWETDPPLTMSVNLSSKQFLFPDLVEHVAAIVREAAIPPGDLRLEITESAIMENVDAAASVLARLRALGLRVSLDDFGTGYSSLSYLHRFPIDTLKIDREFAAKLGDRESREIVRTIVTLARNLGMQVIAEGIESLEQLNQFRAMECELGQGFLFSQPVDADVAGDLLEAQNRRVEPVVEPAEAVA